MHLRKLLPFNIDIEKLLAMSEAAQALTDEQKADCIARQEERRQKSRARTQRFKEKHRDKINAANREYYAEHRDEIRARQREYYAANIDKKRAQARERSMRYYYKQKAAKAVQDKE